jgi:hypothetical protein
MKNNYDKYIKEVWEMKEKAYNDFIKSGYQKYTEYLKNELKGLNLRYSKKTAVESSSINVNR